MNPGEITDRSEFLDRVGGHSPYRVAGKVVKSVGMIFEAVLPGASVGSVCRILTSEAGTARPLRLDESAHALPGVDAEVIGFREKRVVLMPFGDSRGVSTDSIVVLKRSSPTVRLGNALPGECSTPPENRSTEKARSPGTRTKAPAFDRFTNRRAIRSSAP
jgi:flagellum-specific ATP synthase